MRILWFANTSSLYKKESRGYNGGGWIESLEYIVRDVENVNLAVAFFHDADSEKLNFNGVSYYPVLSERMKRNKVSKFFSNWRGKLDDNFDYKFLEIIEDFKPDVIHVFGTEGPFGKIQTKTKVPVVIYIQGLINPCLNAFYPPGFSNKDFLFSKFFLRNNILANGPIQIVKRLKLKADREQEVLKSARYVMGRTDWDFNIVNYLGGDVKYFKINEVLRKDFYCISSVEGKNSTFTIVSTLSSTMYKGIDVILRVVKSLKSNVHINYRWLLVGIEESDPLFRFLQEKVSINASKHNIECLGRLNESELSKVLASSDVYVHPSYIDNSPNSVCEAQIAGIPVIACNVGGVSSIIKDKVTGLLVPANGVFEIASYIDILYNDSNFARMLGAQAKKEAEIRHSKKTISKEIIKTYEYIISNERGAVKK